MSELPFDEPKPPGDDEKPHYLGHRERLREKLFRQGDALPDYELLELVLTLAHSRKDMKPHAKALLRRFGGFAEVIGADPALLLQEKDIGPVAIGALKIVQTAAVRLLRGRLKERSVLGSWDALLDYCFGVMAHEKNEQFRILFLDHKQKLIADEVQHHGTINHTPVYPREVVRRALELGAAAIIIVHNHPSGDPTPSSGDKDMTRQVRDAAKAVGITLHDHLVVGRDGIVSFKNRGLL
ncbi:MAG: DNA repair protein RadC [Alphaproteobacteria bacterium]